jgi:hypothetical protein
MMAETDIAGKVIERIAAAPFFGFSAVDCARMR